MSAIKAKSDKSSFTPEDALGYIQRQMGAMWRGQLDSLHCPYCRGTNVRGCPEFCCRLFGKAFAATLQADELKKTIELGERILEAVDKHPKQVIQ